MLRHFVKNGQKLGLFCLALLLNCHSGSPGVRASDPNATAHLLRISKQRAFAGKAIPAGADLNGLDEKGRSPFWNSLDYKVGDYDFARKLLIAGMDVTTPNADGNIPLVRACADARLGDIDMLKQLIAIKVDFSVTSKDGDNCLDAAIYGNYAATLHLYSAGYKFANPEKTLLFSVLGDQEQLAIVKDALSVQGSPAAISEAYRIALEKKFEESATLLKAAGAEPRIGSFRWYGSQTDFLTLSEGNKAEASFNGVDDIITIKGKWKMLKNNQIQINWYTFKPKRPNRQRSTEVFTFTANWNCIVDKSLSVAEADRLCLDRQQEKRVKAGVWVRSN